MKALRHAQIRAYFFGTPDAGLAPHSQAAGFDELSIFRVAEGTLTLFARLPCGPFWGVQTC
jgi:polyribonucleotide 5'-hydroxyl-kinase